MDMSCVSKAFLNARIGDDQQGTALNLEPLNLR